MVGETKMNETWCLPSNSFNMNPSSSLRLQNMPLLHNKFCKTAERSGSKLKLFQIKTVPPLNSSTGLLRDKTSLCFRVLVCKPRQPEAPTL